MDTKLPPHSIENYSMLREQITNLGGKLHFAKYSLDCSLRAMRIAKSKFRRTPSQRYDYLQAQKNVKTKRGEYNKLKIELDKAIANFKKDTIRQLGGTNALLTADLVRLKEKLKIAKVARQKDTKEATGMNVTELTKNISSLTADLRAGQKKLRELQEEFEMAMVSVLS